MVCWLRNNAKGTICWRACFRVDSRFGHLSTEPTVWLCDRRRRGLPSMRENQQRSANYHSQSNADEVFLILFFIQLLIIMIIIILTWCVLANPNILSPVPWTKENNINCNSNGSNYDNDIINKNDNEQRLPNPNIKMSVTYIFILFLDLILWLKMIIIVINIIIIIILTIILLLNYFDYF